LRVERAEEAWQGWALSRAADILFGSILFFYGSSLVRGSERECEARCEVRGEGKERGVMVAMETTDSAPGAGGASGATSTGTHTHPQIFTLHSAVLVPLHSQKLSSQRNPLYFSIS